MIRSKSGSLSSVRWSAIPDKFGEAIQEGLHYIHRARYDTVLHSGLIMDGYVAPFCYAAFSELDRNYLKDALARSIFASSSIDQLRICVMTRAYGYTPAPKNSMSKLFDVSTKMLGSQGYDLVITALNPFLGFRGSVFSGASFLPFATSPMKYIYDDYGHYLNRRSGQFDTVSIQKLETPPIIWLARPVSRRLRRQLEGAEFPVYNIPNEQYSRG